MSSILFAPAKLLIMNIIKFNRDNDIVYRTINSAKQTIELSIWEYKHKFTTYYGVTLWINFKKSKGFVSDVQTGKCGIESLILGKKLLKEMIHDNPDKKYIIWASDNKRFKVYEYGLKELGFKRSFVDGQKCLIKLPL